MEFFEDGGVKRLITAEQSRGFFSSTDWPYQDRDYPARSVIEFQPDGKVRSVRPVKIV